LLLDLRTKTTRQFLNVLEFVKKHIWRFLLHSLRGSLLHGQGKGGGGEREEGERMRGKKKEWGGGVEDGEGKGGRKGRGGRGKGEFQT
jgi:hypothetical protein